MLMEYPDAEGIYNIGAGKDISIAGPGGAGGAAWSATRPHRVRRRQARRHAAS